MSQSIAFIPWSNCLPSAVVVRSHYDILKGTEPNRNLLVGGRGETLDGTWHHASSATWAFGIYVEAVKTGSPLLLTGMFRAQGCEAHFIGHVGARLDCPHRE